jgi:hypothetical protein
MIRIPDERPSRPEVFVLANPVDVLHKLRWEIDQLKKALVETPEKIAYTHARAYHAFNCSVTAWHLADWVWQDSTLDRHALILEQLGCKDAAASKSAFGSFRKAIITKCRALHICRQVATGSKHMIVRDHPDPTMHVDIQWNLESARVGEARIGDPLVRTPFAHTSLLRSPSALPSCPTARQNRAAIHTPSGPRSA